MEVASDSTWDCVIQQLNQPIIADKTYKMSFWLAASKNYSHMVLRKGLMTDNKPVVLEVWGIDAQNNIHELIHTTKEVTNLDWNKHDITFTTTIDCDYIFARPFYVKEGNLYNGNVLIDNLSPIIEVNE